MPRTVRSEQPADALAQLHADPTERPGLLDGLLVEGTDLFASRRKLMRERISGPDPLPPPRKERPSMVTIPRPVLAPEEAAPVANGATPHAPHANGVSTTGGLRWEIISPEEFAHLDGAPPADLAPILDALAGGDAIRLQVPDPHRQATIQRLRKYATKAGLALIVHRGPGYIAACRKVAP